MRIVHCAYFNTRRLKGCYLAGMGYKLNNGLCRLGHQVLAYNDRETAKLFTTLGIKTAFSRRRANENFYNYCLNVRPDALILGHADTIVPETLLKIRDRLPMLKILQWNVDNINPKSCDGMHNIGNIKSKLAAVDFTLITTADKARLAQFEPDKYRIGFIPNPVDKSIETGRAFANPAPECDLLFAASPDRPRDFGGKIAKGADIAALLRQHINGGTLLFPRISSPSLDGAAYLETLKGTAMVLNLSMVNTDYLYSSDRMAHAMGNGCLAFIDRRTGWGDIFKDDEAGFFSSPEEIYDKANFFIRHPQIRQKIAENGWRKYHKLFNETAVAGYAAALLDGSFAAENYPFPTLL